MHRFLAALLAVSLGFLAVANAGPDDKQGQLKVRPAVAKLIQGSAQDFIKFFDKNKDGYLSKNELPEGLQAAFDKFDKNGDDKLDKEEVGEMLKVLRQRLGATPQKAGNQKAAKQPELDRVVADMLRRLDTNKDGKISKDEAKGRPLANVFDRFDANKDGYLDKDELRKAAQQMLAADKAGRPAAGARSLEDLNEADFDALDLNADGRLTRDELKGTPYAAQFDVMDTNKDGKIDRKEFTAYLMKQTVEKNDRK